MAGRVLLIVCVATGCSSPAREQVDASPDVAPHCGDGIINRNPPLFLSEDCDDGEMNGTASSLCAKQCLSGEMTAVSVPAVPLGRPTSRAVGIHFDNNSHDGIAFTAFDGTGVHVRRTFDPLALPSSPVVDLMVNSPPVALGSVATPDGRAPIWIEGPTGNDPALHMYYANVASDLQATIHEVPYPFSDGTSPSLVLPILGGRNSVLIVDQSATAPYDLLIAVVVVRAPDDVEATTLRVAAPGRVRGTVIAALNSDRIENRDMERIVQFFDDTGTFVALEDHADNWLDPNTTYHLAEEGRGNWPFRVIAAGLWTEGTNAERCDSESPALSHPMPLAVLTDLGDIYLWQFLSGVDGNELVAPWGHVAPGTTAFETVGVNGGLWSVHAIEPDGSRVDLVDSDCKDLRSPPMREQRFFGTPYSAATYLEGMCVTCRSLVLDGDLVRW